MAKKPIEAHSDRAHAKLSASGSARWMNCPGSVAAEEPYPQKPSSVFALEGTRAHEVAEKCFRKNCDAEKFIGEIIEGEEIDQDMTYYVQQYVDYVRSFETDDCEMLIEERLDFSHLVPGGFGTGDNIIILPKEKTVHIFDLKYGKGVEVHAFENTQAQLYASGVLNEFGFLHDIEKIHIHIVQPRLRNYDEWSISREDLLEFGKVASEKAQLALSPGAPRVPGNKQCQWCAAKGDCNVLATFMEEVITATFDDLDDMSTDVLSDERKKQILDNKKLISDFVGAVEATVFAQLEEGKPFKGYKLVEGRSVRQYLDGAEEVLQKELGDDAYSKKLIGITAAEKKLGKPRMNELTHKPVGKPTLAPEADKRKPIAIEDTSDHFEEL